MNLQVDRVNNKKIVYQPQYCNEIIIGLEALTRIDNVLDIEKYVVSESNVLQFDRELVEMVVKDIDLYGISVPVSINCSSISLVDPDFVDFLINKFINIRCVIELTEHFNITDMHALKNNLIALKNNGFKISLDDLGRNELSYDVFLELGGILDQVKIDGGLVYGIENNAYRQRRLVSVCKLIRVNEIKRGCV